MLCLCFAFGAQAQDAASLRPLGKTVLETNLEKNVWFSSDNPSLMSIKPLASYGNASLDYDLENGKYKLQQQGDKVKNISFNASGAAMVGKFALWGEFHFNNIFTDSTRFNSDIYDPYDDMPYYVGDPNRSYWTGQSYEMRAKIASPFYWNRLSFGVELQYVTQTSGKQVDPRGNPFKYNATVIPGLTFIIGKNDYIGVNGYYRNRYQRSSTENQNYGKDQKIYLLKGLGNYSTAYVGGVGGIGSFYWNGDRFGGGIQYSHTGSIDLLAEGDFEMQKEDCFQNPTVPRPMGSISQLYGSARIAMLFGADKSNKVSVDGYFKSTDGIEYVTKYDATYGVKAWQVLSSSAYSNYMRIHGKVAYDKFIGGKAGNGYVWKLGADAKFDMENDQYFSPACTFNYMNATVEVNAKRSLWFGPTNLILGFFGGYKMGFGGEYTYTASDAATAVPANVWYPLDLAYYKANCATFGGDIYFGWKVSKRMEVFATGNCSYNAAFLPEAVIAPNGTSVGLYGNSRILAHGAIGISF